MAEVQIQEESSWVKYQGSNLSWNTKCPCEIKLEEWDLNGRSIELSPYFL